MSSPATTTADQTRIAPTPAAPWWRQAVIYQIYPRSFADSDGDGIGDLAGVLSRVDYLASLGVDAVWLSPLYPSDLSDGGYDVDHHRDVDPVLGTLEEFDTLVRTLHERGLKVLMDIVPNHSSDRHVWFRAALAAGRGSAERSRYVFRDGRGEHGEIPPTDWETVFGGGPAWTQVDDGQWYLHLFTSHQPDWNWQNADVRDDYLQTLRFWGDRGVDGFRVDFAMGLAKDLSEPLPAWEEVLPGIAVFKGLNLDDPFEEGRNPLFDRDEVHDIYAQWRTVFDRYSPPLFGVAEVWVTPRRRIRYATTESLGQAFNFDLMTAPWNAAEFKSVIQENLELAARHGTSNTWVFSNHDVVRHATRLSPEDEAVGRQRAAAATLLSLALPGSAYLYQGEELGLPEVELAPEHWQDPMAPFDHHGDAETRDGCRVPLPWSDQSPAFGFSDHGSHLPQPEWFGALSVQEQDADESSTLSLYRTALELRRRLLSDESVEWLDGGADVVAFRRANGWTSVTNFGAGSVALPEGRVVLSTQPTTPEHDLPGNATAWLQSHSTAG